MAVFCVFLMGGLISVKSFWFGVIMFGFKVCLFFVICVILGRIFNIFEFWVKY